ncbi:hypothetical protein [Paenibacillus daejeonensis]|nr:hypothetical protein [Paenibacillus daejeonensis]
MEMLILETGVQIRQVQFKLARIWTNGDNVVTPAISYLQVAMGTANID